MNKTAHVLIVSLCVAMQPLAAQYRAALPGYRYKFPRDHFNHPDFQTEWWYYTGNLKDSGGHRFGFELTFFRQGVKRNISEDLSRNAVQKAADASVWGVSDVFVAHLALSDLDAGKFYRTERINRAGPGIAGISESADDLTGRVWNGNWQVKWRADDQELQAIAKEFQLRFVMHPRKPPVIHGENGVSQKAAGSGHASHYISLTRLDTTGSIELAGKQFDVTGLAWMDHEFFTNQLTAEQAGWDWLSAQLDDHTELMLFRIRRKDGTVDRFSAGTCVDASGKATHLNATQFTLQPAEETWVSPATNGRYPIHWNIAIPSLGIELDASTPLAAQELSSKTAIVPNYWEGAIQLNGKQIGQHTAIRLTGVGYLEMTGYDRPVALNILR